MINFKEIIKEIAAYMERNNLNQSGFAERMQVSVSTVSLWMRGQRKPNTENYLRFYELLQEEKCNGAN